MSIFKNANETAFVGGRKHWTDVIKNSGPGELLIWRQPEEDFNTSSTLIVMPGEAAIFVNGGKVEQVFDKPDTYKLSTKNYPFISRLRNMFSGGVSIFNCVVYFVRTAVSAEILWGTALPLQVRDKLLGIATQVRAHGSYQIRVAQPQAFLEKLVGNNVPMQTQEDLNKYFSNQFQSEIIAELTRALNETETELLGITARLTEFSDILKPAIEKMVAEYGFTCVKFTVSGMEIADDELRRRYDEIGMDAIAELRRAKAQKGVMDILGDDWGRQKEVEILFGMANNPSGGAASAGAGIGLGLAGLGAFTSMGGQMLSGGLEGKEQKLDPIETLTALKKLLDEGLITQEDYDARKNEVLSQMVDI